MTLMEKQTSIALKLTIICITNVIAELTSACPGLTVPYLYQDRV